MERAKEGKERMEEMRDDRLMELMKVFFVVVGVLFMCILLGFIALFIFYKIPI